MLLGTLWFLVHDALLIYDSEWKIVSHQLGWTGERSVPVTVELGYWSAISIAQIPVPVPTSKILIGFNRGARCRLPPHRSVMTWCLRSIRSISRYRTLHVNLSKSRLCLCHGIWAKSTRKAGGSWCTNLVVGERVRPSSITVISSPIFILVVQHAGCYRRCFASRSPSSVSFPWIARQVAHNSSCCLGPTYVRRLAVNSGSSCVDRSRYIIDFYHWWWRTNGSTSSVLIRHRRLSILPPLCTCTESICPKIELMVMDRFYVAKWGWIPTRATWRPFFLFISYRKGLRF